MIELKYANDNTDELFDMAQGIGARKKYIVKGRRKIRKFTAITNTLVWRGLALILVSFLGQIMVSMYDLESIIYDFYSFGLCAGVILFAVGIYNRIMYQKFLKKYKSKQNHKGTILFDEFGVKDITEDGGEVKFVWSEYQNCVICENVIVLLFDSPIVFLISNKDEYANTICEGLSNYGKEDSIIWR